MSRILCALPVLAVACGSPDLTPPISAEPGPSDSVVVKPQPIAPQQAPPTITERPPPPVLLAPAPPGAPPPIPADAPVGYHSSGNGACFLPDVIAAGSCKCAVYDTRGKLVTPGEVCSDSCKENSDGVVEFHSFCVDGGLAADMHPR